MGHAPTVRSTTGHELHKSREGVARRYYGIKRQGAVDLLVLQTWPIDQVALAYCGAVDPRIPR